VCSSDLFAQGREQLALGLKIFLLKAQYTLKQIHIVDFRFGNEFMLGEPQGSTLSYPTTARINQEPSLAPPWSRDAGDGPSGALGITPALPQPLPQPIFASYLVSPSWEIVPPKGSEFGLQRATIHQTDHHVQWQTHVVPSSNQLSGFIVGTRCQAYSPFTQIWPPPRLALRAGTLHQLPGAGRRRAQHPQLRNLHHRRHDCRHPG